MASHLLRRAVPVLRLRLAQREPAVRFVTWKGLFPFFKSSDHQTQLHNNVKNIATAGETEITNSVEPSSSDQAQLQDNVENIPTAGETETEITTSVEQPSSSPFIDSSNDRELKNIDHTIISDVGPIISHAKDIIHSGRYFVGEPLSAEDEKVVVEKLLPYHPDYEDKIGPGIDFIRVGRESRGGICLFVVRTDGGQEDFSYHMCLQAYIRQKYPAYAERFIKEHWRNRGSRYILQKNILRSIAEMGYSITKGR